MRLPLRGGSAEGLCTSDLSDIDEASHIDGLLKAVDDEFNSSSLSEISSP